MKTTTETRKADTGNHPQPAKKTESAPKSNGNAVVFQTRQTSGNSSAPQVRTDGSDASAKVAALGVNERVSSVMSNVMGPEDPAAKYRSTTKVPLEGYDQAKLDDPSHQTPKYIFGRVAQNFKLDSVQGNKANAQDLLNAMVPELEKAGLDIVGVEGDRIQVKTEVGYEWVDVVRGAGSDKPGWWWGSEGVGTEEPTKNSKEWAAKTAQSSSSGGHSQAAAAGGGGAAAGGAAAPAGPAKEIVLGKQIDQGKVMGILTKHQPSNEGIKKAVAELQESFPGVKVMEHPTKLDKLQFSNGAIVDVIVGCGGPNPSWGWMPEN